MLYPFFRRTRSFVAGLKFGLVILVALFASSHTALAQSKESLELSIRAYDELFATLPADQEDVLIGDMRFKRKFLQEWRNHLHARLHNDLSAHGAFDFSTGKAWPGGKVPYIYDDSVPEDVRVLFESAIRLWQVEASLNFVTRTTETDYLIIKFTGYARNAAMNSWVGVQGRGQDLNVAGWGNRIDCAHELGHALGMTHEQCRSDRDTYVTIISTNLTVDPASNVNYAIVPTSINRTAYDFDSLMHYPRDAFARTNGLLTLVAKPPNEKWSDGRGPEEIGQKTHLSAGDKAAMAGQYGAPLTIGGRIVDAAGNPLPGIQVALSGGSTYRGPNPISTDATGRYSFTGIPRNSGTYTLTPNQPGTSFTRSALTASITTSSQTAVNFTSIDSAPPDLLIDVPAVSGIYSTAPTVSGTAKDSVGIREVRVALARTSDLVWWNWSNNSWGSTTFSWANNVRIASGTTSWSTSLPSLAVGGYQVHVQSVDLSDNASPWRFRHFFVDPEPPRVAVTHPLHKSAVSELTTIRGTATDGAGTGITNNVVHFTLYQNGAFWTGFHWKENTSAQDPEVLLTTDVVAGQWAYNSVPEGSKMRSGTYYISLFARDNAGNTSIPQAGVNSTEFTIDNSPPSVAITYPTDGLTVTNLTRITGKASDGKELQSVNLYLYRYSDNQFWDGTAWGGGGSAILPVTINPDGTWASSGPLPSSLSSNPANRLSNGGYNIMAFAVDNAGNQTRADVVFNVEYYPTFTYTAGSYSDSDPNNNNDNWSNPANWRPYGVPGAGDIAIINSGNPTISGTVHLRQLQLNGGTLRGGSLRFAESGKMIWTAGTLSTHVTFQPGADLHVTGAAEKHLSSGIKIELNGSSTWDGTGHIHGSGTSLIRNNGTMTTASSFNFVYYNNGAYPIGTLENFGTWNKIGDGITRFTSDYGGWGFTNAGTINIDAGSILLNNAAHLGGTIAGNGRLVGQSGTLHLNGTTTLNGGTLELRTGTLEANGSFAGNGTFLWTGGTVAGSLTNEPSSTLRMTSGADKTLASGARLLNRGFALWDAGALHTSGNSRLHNEGTFEFAGNVSVHYYNNGVYPRGEFLNTGLALKSGTGVVTFRNDYGGCHFHNQGETRVLDGLFRLSGGGSTKDATFRIAPDALLELSPGEPHEFSGALSIQGGGRMKVAGAWLKFGDARVSIAEDTTYQHATGDATGAFTLAGPGTFEWSGGTLNATMTWQSSLKTIITGAAEKNLEGGRIKQLGTVIWTGSGLLRSTGGALIENVGLFEMQSDSGFIYYNNGVYPAGTFLNLGTLRKTNSTGASRFRDDYSGWLFFNRGVIDLQSGSLELRVNATFEAGGSFEGPGSIRITSGTATLEGTNTVGTGTIELASGYWTSQSGLLSGPGTFLWTGGHVNGLTTLGLTNFVISGSLDKHIGTAGVIRNHGLARWTGTGALRLTGQSSFENYGHFEAESDAALYYYNNGAYPRARFLNAGTFTKTGGTNETLFSYDYGGPAFENFGLVSVQTGRLSLGGGGLWSNSRVAVAENSELRLIGGTFELTNSTTFAQGFTRIKGAEMLLLNSTNHIAASSRLLLESGSIIGNGAIAGTGDYEWAGGSMAGRFDLINDLKWLISSDADKHFSAGTINNHANATWTGKGAIRAQGATTLANNGTFNIQNDVPFFYYNNGIYPAARFVNNGLMTKTESTGTTTFTEDYGGWDFYHNGTLRVDSGTLRLRSDAYFTDAKIQGAGKVLFERAALTLAGTIALENAGTLELASGNAKGTNSFTGPGTVLWTGTELRGAHTISPAGRMTLSGAADKPLASYATLNNEGELTWQAGRISGNGQSRLNNSGLFQITGDSSLFYYNNGIYPAAAFSNTGVIRKSGTTGTTAFLQDYGGWIFSNSGTLDIQSGKFDLGPNYVPTADSRIHLVVGGLNPGTDYSQLIFRGRADFLGTLQVTLTNNFLPTPTNSFTLATYPSYNGKFVSPALPVLASGSNWKLDYKSTGLQMYIVPPTAIDPGYGYSKDGKFNLTLNGVPGQYALLQGSTNLVNWYNIQTNQPFTGTFDFTDPQATNQNAFYRTIIVE